MGSMSLVISPPEHGILTGQSLIYLIRQKLISYRDDKLLFKPECYCGPGETGRDETTGVCTSTENKQPDWSAWWFDIRTPACIDNIKEVHTARMVAAASKGCDAIDPDNVDSVCRVQLASRLADVQGFQ